MKSSELLYVSFVCISVTLIVFTAVYCMLKDLKFPIESEGPTAHPSLPKKKTD